MLVCESEGLGIGKVTLGRVGSPNLPKPCEELPHLDWVEKDLRLTSVPRWKALTTGNVSQAEHTALVCTHLAATLSPECCAWMTQAIVDEDSLFADKHFQHCIRRQLRCFDCVSTIGRCCLQHEHRSCLEPHHALSANADEVASGAIESFAARCLNRLGLCVSLPTKEQDATTKTTNSSSMSLWWTQHPMTAAPKPTPTQPSGGANHPCLIDI